jgi:signal transduction histidine kinase/CheY-like chemotaxis protein
MNSENRRLVWGSNVVLLISIGLIATTLILASQYVAKKSREKSLALSSVALSLRERTTRAHLWFEEAISGDASIDLNRQVYGLIDETMLSLAKEKIAIEREDADLGAHIATTIQEIERWRELTKSRWNNRASAGVGTPLDDEFDDVFEKIQGDCELLNGGINALLQTQSERSENLQTVLVLALLAVLCMAALYGAKQQATVERRTDELRESVRTANAASAAKATFLTTMSHEIRTPLNAVIGMTDLLLDTHMTAQQHSLASTVHSSGNALLSIINDILDFSKIEAGKLDLERVPFCLRESVEDALDIVSHAARKKGLELVCDLPLESDTPVWGDGLRLRQVLVNLLSNAVKFTPRGQVKLEALMNPRSGKFFVTFNIVDTGVGIAAENLSTLFQSFKQVDASTTRKYGGTGLGLAISKQLVEAMQGTIRVESTLGQGTTFTISLAFDSAMAVEKGGRVADQPFRVKQAVKALVVDDNETNRKHLIMQLSAWGINVVAVESGAEALALLKTNTAFQFALLDFNMPEMNGVELARSIRAQGHYFPLALLSSSFESKDDEAALFTSIASKPVRQQRLLELTMALVAGCERPQEKVAEPVRLSALRVLVAEDNPVNQQVALLMLAKLGFTADLAEDGMQAVECVRRVSYDIVLMDMQMPNLDGMGATRLIRTLDLPRQPYVIAVSANATMQDEVACRAAGMNDFVSKPLTIARLRKALEGKSESGSQRSLGETAATFDSATIQELKDIGALQPVFESFAREIPKQLALLQERFLQRNAILIQAVAHTMKGSARSTGAHRLAALCGALEQAMREGDWSRGEEQINAVVLEANQAQSLVPAQLDYRH